MLPWSLCRLWQADRAANAAQDTRSYTTARGTISQSNIDVVDIDPRNGGEQTFRALVATHGSLTSGVISSTGGGGRHLVFERLSFKTSKNALGKGIDFLSDGQYFVAPASLHLSGNTYLWEKE